MPYPLNQANFDLVNDRVLYLEGLINSLGKLLSGKVKLDGSSGSLLPPSNDAMDAVLQEFGNVIVLSSHGNNCPPWCPLPPVGTGQNLNTLRPTNWPPKI